MVLAEVTEFTALARAGAYMGGDRRVTPTERTRWRLTFQRLAGQGCAALRAPEPDRAAEALTLLIDLANDMCDSDYFHSGDPVEAAGFVLSDAAALLWDFTRDRHGFAAFADLAAPQLIRWESCYGWTRSGYGKTSKKETSLAQVLASMLRTPGTWTGFAQHYLAALDQLGIAAGRSAYAGEYRSDRLAQWHQMLADRLAGGPEEALVDRRGPAGRRCRPGSAHAGSGDRIRAGRSSPGSVQPAAASRWGSACHIADMLAPDAGYKLGMSRPRSVRRVLQS
jgi:hypothetical protein